ncbi:MAG: hypothetical protein IT379_02630 [Deltaproteobacteria bacterium]|nr:hypothetical protein [Deltaproteobacteria bacterium]
MTPALDGRARTPIGGSGRRVATAALAIALLACSDDAALLASPSSMSIPSGQWMVGATFWIGVQTTEVGLGLVAMDPDVLALDPPTSPADPSTCGGFGCGFSVRAHAVGEGDARVALVGADGRHLDEQLVGVRRPDTIALASISPDDDVELPMPDENVWWVDADEVMTLRATPYAGSSPLFGAPAIRASIASDPLCVSELGGDQIRVRALGPTERELTIQLGDDASSARTVTLRGVAARDAVRELRVESIRGLVGRPAAHVIALTAAGEVVHNVRDVEWTMETVSTSLGIGSVLQSGSPDVVPRAVRLVFGAGVARLGATVDTGSYAYVRDPPRRDPSCADPRPM